MDVEEIKKIIQDKIEADESASEVRKRIKTYIREKQDAREGFNGFNGNGNMVATRN